MKSAGSSVPLTRSNEAVVCSIDTSPDRRALNSMPITETGSKRPGRPTGQTDTRRRILESARKLFARKGINGVTIRDIAAAANVDPALVHHYFGTKRQLFAAAISTPMAPLDKSVHGARIDEIGDKLASLLLPLWDSEAGAGLIAALRSAVSDEELRLLRLSIEDIVAAQVGSRVVDDPPGTRAIRIQLATAQLVGVAVTRHILKLDPFASIPREELAATIGPTLQNYLTELPHRRTGNLRRRMMRIRYKKPCRAGQHGC